MILKGPLSPRAHTARGPLGLLLIVLRVRKGKFYARSVGVISLANECCVGDGAHAV